MRENEKISDLDLRHIFDKVDRNNDQQVNRMVSRRLNQKISELRIRSRRCDLLVDTFASSLGLISSG